jgi:hypothetical protein
MLRIDVFSVIEVDDRAAHLFKSGESYVEIRGSGIAGGSNVRITTSDNSKEWKGGLSDGDRDPSNSGAYTKGVYKLRQTKPAGTDSAIGGGDGGPVGVTVTVTVTNTNDDTQSTLYNQSAIEDD